MKIFRHLIEYFPRNSDLRFWLVSIAAHSLLLAFIGGIVLREDPAPYAKRTQFFYIADIQEQKLKDEVGPLTAETPEFKAPDTSKFAEASKPQSSTTSQAQEKGIAIHPPLSLPSSFTHVDNKVAFFGLQPAGEKIVFVVDISGSMLDKEGDLTRLEIAEKEIRTAIGKLHHKQHFNIILFGDRIAKLFKTTVAPTPENKSRAFSFLEEDHNLGGSTNLSAALSAAIEMCPDAIVTLTDGEANDSDDTILSQVRYLRNKLSPRTQIHAIGFFLKAKGHPDRFLARLTSENDGTYLRWSKEMHVASLLNKQSESTP